MINGKEYLYEITPYYDKEKKQIRQKSKYLGKNVNGVPVRVRGQSQTPKKVLSHGEFVPLKQIVEDLALDKILADVMPAKDVWPVLTLAMNYATRPRSLAQIQSWYEGTVFAEDHPNLALSSQSLSRLLSRLGESTTNLDFSRGLIQQTSTSKTLVYDITSLSSYSEGINLLEYGYNRDGLDLPQINLSLIVDKDLGIPVMYDLYPGSIVDVSTLKNTIKMIKAEGVRDYILIMDRGFFSTANIEEMVSNDFSFIILKRIPRSLLRRAPPQFDCCHNLYYLTSIRANPRKILSKNNCSNFQRKPSMSRPGDAVMPSGKGVSQAKGYLGQRGLWERRFDPSSPVCNISVWVPGAQLEVL